MDDPRREMIEQLDRDLRAQFKADREWDRMIRRQFWIALVFGTLYAVAVGILVPKLAGY